MRSEIPGVGLVVCLSAAGLSLALAAAPTMAWAQPKNKKAAADVGAGSDKSFDKQTAWEQKVMGDDGAKKADMKKIAAAQRLAEETRKNPPPEPAKKYKDPNKEGARAKNEASIGLPIASDEALKSQPKRAPAPAPIAKKAAPASSGSDELGALVASSIADEHKASAAPSPASEDRGKARGARGKSGKGRSTAKAAPAPSSLDRMFSAGQ